MRRPRSKIRTATAVLILGVLGGACVTNVHNATAVHHSAKEASIAKQRSAPDSPPVAVTAASLEGLSSRIQLATQQATEDGAQISVLVHDRVTGTTVSNNSDAIIATASVAKLFIADDLLYMTSNGDQLEQEDRDALDRMLEASDDGAAEVFWERGGGDAIVQRVASRYGLQSTGPGDDGAWWNTVTTATDLAQYYDMLLDGTGGLRPDVAAIIVDDLAQSSPQGEDGYPQRFGIPDGLFGEPVAVKQGWMSCIGDAWMHLSTGLVGADRRYVMVIESLQSGDDVTARSEITQAVRTIFPSGRI
jgi:hypothetical protein